MELKRGEMGSLNLCQFCKREIIFRNVEIEAGTTKLNSKSWVLCSQPYPIEKKLFEQPGVWCAGMLSAEKMDEIDEATYIGLCMGLQHELATEPADVESN